MIKTKKRVMMKRMSVFSIIIILVFIVSMRIVVAPADEYESEDDDNWSGSTVIEEGDDDDNGGIDWEDAVEEGEEGEDEATYDSASPGFSLYMEMRVYCHDTDRDGQAGGKLLAYDKILNDEGTGYGYIYGDDGYKDLPPFLPYDEDFTQILTYFQEEEDGTYSWISYFGDISISTESSNVFDNAKLHRYEGTVDTTYHEWDEKGCVPYVGLINTIDFTGDWFVFDVVGNYYSQENLDGDGNDDKSIKVKYDDNDGYDIRWDTTETDCTAIGGEYTDASGYTSYACCGDDAMWIKNRAVNDDDGFDTPEISDDQYEEVVLGTESVGAYCLYGTDAVDVALDFISGDAYICTETGFTAYDDTLKEDDDYDDDYDETEFETPVPFFFKGTGDYETDIGKWSDNNNLNPQFCYYEYDGSLGETYKWIDINEAGDMPVNDNGEEITDFYNDADETLCEAYLGGVWTGQYCCGNKYDYDWDAYDYGHENEYFAESFSDPTPIYYEDGSPVLRNYACVQGEVLDAEGADPTVFFVSDIDGVAYELLNVDGNLYGCNIEDTTQLGVDYYTLDDLIPETTDQNNRNIAGCDVIGEKYLCTYYPDAEEGQYLWQWEDVTVSSYVKNTLLYNSGEDFTLSSAALWVEDADGDGYPDNEEYTQLEACCAGNACWDGKACVPENTQYEYDADNDGENDAVAICSLGDWQKDVEPKYDWYYNTDAEAVDYCAYPYACVCSTNDDDATFCTENEDYVVAGCTIQENFYKDDHYCEAYTDSTTDTSRWTSRTKLVAFQLLEIAIVNPRADVTLFCSDYVDAINNYATLDAVASDINSVCVLDQGGSVIVGLTLNSDDDDEPMTLDVNDLLFDNSNGIITQAFDENDVENCDAALGAGSGEQFGEFYSCDSSTTWFNEEINAVIYAKDGLSYGTVIDYPSIDWQGGFDAYKTIITNHLETNTITNPDGDELYDADDEEGYFDGFYHIQDYNNLYYNYDADNGNTIFAFEEIKHSETGSDTRYYMGAVYTGYALDCDQIYAPYGSSAIIHCSNDADPNIVLEGSIVGSEHWNDLTATIRVE